MDLKIKCPHCEHVPIDNIIGQECFECKGRIDIKRSYTYLAKKFKSLADTFEKKATNTSDNQSTVHGLPGWISDSPESPDSSDSPAS